jgi:hypothetical protein
MMASKNRKPSPIPMQARRKVANCSGKQMAFLYHRCQGQSRHCKAVDWVGFIVRLMSKQLGLNLYI